MAKKKKRKSRRLTWRGGMKDENFSSVEDAARGEKNEREDTQKKLTEKEERKKMEREINREKKEEENIVNK